MTQTNQHYAHWSGRTLYDSSGAKVGQIGQLWADDADGHPTWLTTRTGMFGTRESFVPVQGVQERDDGNLETRYPKELIKDAPQVEPAPTERGQHLDVTEEQQLYRHYQLAGEHGAQAGHGGGRPAGAEGHDVSGPTTDEAMTRSEERLRVGTERRERGRARLRKYVVTETEQVEVPVTREEVRVEREPITDANREQAMSGPGISEEEHEVTLHEERPVVATEAVPVERVRLAKHQVQDTETVRGEVRKEHIDTDTGAEHGRRE
ncbi:DUF2382 domain-containing protein [Amycolatopsis viridis]|uniref:Uncharacterized protein (TIGR02271 family) n=1 Tax=Amycolatopsis viridis TaxID=185678 RepID=A0ABX0T1U7_9PSEU|nr:PRC and DUF2382 domain-containing protein [Amycolatopsis viridis]NIH82177.1 uncharacterized protein (TIGR02271 family) [Amycolatopsis viridis]